MVAQFPKFQPSTTVNSPPPGRGPRQRSSEKPASQFQAPATPSVNTDPRRKSTPPPSRPPTVVPTRALPNSSWYPPCESWSSV